MLKFNAEREPLSTEEALQVALRDTDEEVTGGGPSWAYEVFRIGVIEGSSANFYIRAKQDPQQGAHSHGSPQPDEE
jgi:hypothetical protein